MVETPLLVTYDELVRAKLPVALRKYMPVKVEDICKIWLIAFYYYFSDEKLFKNSYHKVYRIFDYLSKLQYAHKDFRQLRYDYNRLVGPHEGLLAIRMLTQHLYVKLVTPEYEETVRSAMAKLPYIEFPYDLFTYL